MTGIVVIFGVDSLCISY